MAALILAFSAMLRWLLFLARTQSAAYSFEGYSFEWWIFAQDVLVGAAALAVILAVVALLRRRPELPVPPTQPRTWRTYLSPGQLWLPGAAFFALLGLIAFAGSVSSQDENGIYRLLVVGTGTEAKGSSEFFGWAYGLSVAATALVLAVLTVAVLHSNARRPFLRPDSVASEEASRRALSTRILWLVSGVLLLTFARAAISVGAASRMEVHMPDFVWGSSIAALDPWLTWVGMATKLWAYTLLLLVAGTTRFRRERIRAGRRDSTADHEITVSALDG